MTRLLRLKRFYYHPMHCALNFECWVLVSTAPFGSMQGLVAFAAQMAA
jgi:hypothetical protein